MDYGREVGFSSGNVVQILTGTQSNGFDDNWGPGSDNQAIWATEDDYRDWTRETSVETISQTRSGSEPPNKKSRNSQSGDNRSKTIGKMFFKTKLCCKFRARTCPYTTNCNFAHSVEELRRPPPNWQEIVAAHEEERGVSSETREEFQIPALESSAFEGEAQSSRERGDKFGSGECGGGGTYGNNAIAANLKPSNWKTRICNKWELTGYCPFGNKCHFAHGAQELHRYGGGLMEGEDRAASSASPDRKQGAVPSKIPADTVVASMTSVPHSDGYHIGVPSQRLSNVIQRTGQRPHQKWKGPDKISRIYGDWIDDAE
ncbi:zinc finger (CCCH-type) family protein [Actinidia rufa]|uniref:Zinc finger (CCCH-type) family protein n=1 Tax=Actinidia rufa TaxID=165716 RepID=A0A7J0GXH6_9ERIC|nr:zinc finger (CCCH-type) family protein [Actinidia rufa]